MKGTKEERDKAEEEAQVARLDIVATGDAKTWMEEARRKAKAETTRLEVKQTSLLLDIGAAKDEVCSLQSQAGKDKKAMEEDYQKALKVIFVYNYRCCAFKHNICRDLLEVPEGMPNFSISLPSEFFAILKCPSISAAIEDMAAEPHLSEAVQELQENTPARDQS